MSRFIRVYCRACCGVCWVVMCAFFLLGLGQPASAEDFAPVVRETSFAAGGVVILDANVGDVRVRPTDQEGKLRLVITAHKQEDATAAPHWVREFAANGSQAKIVLEMPKHGEHNFDVTLYVPKRSDLRLNLEVGDLTIEGITGNADAEVGVGDLKITVPDPHAYRAVAMSVHIGDVHAGAFGLEPHGFLGKSVEREFSAGSYRLKLHTGIGDVSCEAGGA
jgi:hypothetical protein